MGARLNGWLVLILLLGIMAYCIAEELTLTTYYPSPRGVYNELRTRGDVAIGKLDAPSARLEIVGGGATSATSALLIRNVDGTRLVDVKNDGKVGIGTNDPGAKLEVAGQVKITGGTPGAGKVLTSDASGLASWQLAVPTGASDPPCVDGAMYYNTATKVHRVCQGWTGTQQWLDLKGTPPCPSMVTGTNPECPASCTTTLQKLWIAQAIPISCGAEGMTSCSVQGGWASPDHFPPGSMYACATPPAHQCKPTSPSNPGNNEYWVGYNPPPPSWSAVRCE